MLRMYEEEVEERTCAYELCFAAIAFIFGDGDGIELAKCSGFRETID